MIDTLLRDLRFTLRLLARAPLFTAVIVATLALGIGANAVIFNLLDQVLLRRLPVKNPQELVVLDGPGAFQGFTIGPQTFSYPMYRDFRDRNTVFSGVIARFPTNLNLSDGSGTEQVRGELVSGNFFDVLGVQAAIGRTLTDNDDRTPGAHPVAMLSHGFWLRRFGGSPAVLNRVVTVNGQPLTVVGVTVPGFNGVVIGDAPDVFVPLMMKAQMTPTWDRLFERRARWVNVLARLGPGVGVEQASAAMNVLYRQINEAELREVRGGSARFRQAYVDKRLQVLPGANGLSGLRAQISLPLYLLMGMVGLVLIIACANVANLLLARAVSRQREIAIRLSLGAGRRDLARQLLIESLVLALAGGGAGVLLAAFAGPTLLQALPFDEAGRAFRAEPDARVLGVMLAVTVATGLVFGLAPVLQLIRPSLVTTLKEEATAVAGGSVALRKTLVVAQVALSMLLLVGSGLFARSLYNLRTLDPGFTTGRLLSFDVNPALNGYTQERVRALAEELTRSIGAVPGVETASIAQVPVLRDSLAQITVRVDGYQPREEENMNPGVNWVAPGFFATMQLPLIAGREFTERDTRGAPPVAIVNETMARYFFKGENAVGRRFGLGGDPATTIEIVGVVKDGKHSTLRDEPRRFFYLPLAQNQELESLTFYVRSRVEPGAVAEGLRQAVRRVDPSLPVTELASMETTVNESLYLDRLVAGLAVCFGLLATLLAAIGLYGVMSYTVAARTREIGIRLALGAAPGRVLRKVLGEVGLLAGAGILVGLPTALALGRYVESQLFGLTALDPATLAGAGGILAVVAALAGAVPATRAARVDPQTALRMD